jgi:hypothetical protein
MPYSDTASNCDEETGYRCRSGTQYRAANCRQHPAIPLTQRQENPNRYEANQHHNRACTVVEWVSVMNVRQHSPKHIHGEADQRREDSPGKKQPYPSEDLGDYDKFKERH